MSAPEPTYKCLLLSPHIKMSNLLTVSLTQSRTSAQGNTRYGNWQPIQKYRHHFRSETLSTQNKVRIFKTYVETTLLYNSETWALTSTLDKSLDAFHRRLLRIVSPCLATFLGYTLTHQLNKHYSST